MAMKNLIQSIFILLVLCTNSIKSMEVTADNIVSDRRFDKQITVGNDSIVSSVHARYVLKRRMGLYSQPLKHNLSGVFDKLNKEFDPLQLDTKGNSKRTLLMCLAELLEPELVQLALLGGADVQDFDNKSFTAGHYVLWARRKDPFQSLCRKYSCKAINNQAEKRRAIVMLLLQHGADFYRRSQDVDHNSTYVYMIRNYLHEFHDILLEKIMEENSMLLTQINAPISNKNRHTALCCEMHEIVSIPGPNTNVVEFLVNHGASLDVDGTCFLTAYANMPNDIARLFISSGAQVNKQMKHSLDTPLHETVRQCMEYIFSESQKTYDQQQFNDLLQSSEKFKKLLGRLQILIINGASFNIVNGAKRTPYGIMNDYKSHFSQNIGAIAWNYVAAAWRDAVDEVNNIEIEAAKILGRELDEPDMAHILLSIAQQGCPVNEMRKRRNNLVERMKKWGVNRTLKDEKGYTVFIHAMLNKDIDLYNILNEDHVSVNMPNVRRRNASFKMNFTFLNHDSNVSGDLYGAFKRQRTS